jgi:hypothetical protein
LGGLGNEHAMPFATGWQQNNDINMAARARFDAIVACDARSKTASKQRLL